MAKVRPTSFDALHCVVDYCHGMVAKSHTGEVRCSTPVPFGAVVDLYSGGCLYVSGIRDPRVVNRIRQFMSKSEECVAAWAADIVTDGTGDVVINLQWGTKTATTVLPCTNPDFQKWLTEVNWTSSPSSFASEPKKTQNPLAQMSSIEAEKILREYVDLEGAKILQISNSEPSENTQQAEELALQGRGWFLDRDNCDMFFDRFFGGFSQVSNEFHAIRERLETFSSGRKAVNFAIAMYSNGIHIETKLWHKKMPFWGW